MLKEKQLNKENNDIKMDEFTNDLIFVSSDEFSKYIHLYDTKRDLRLIIIASMASGRGNLWVDNIENPHISLYTNEYLVAIYGDYSHSLSKEILALIPIHKMIFAPDGWETIIREVFKRRLIVKKDARYRLDAKSLKIDYLKELKSQYLTKNNYDMYSFGLLEKSDTISEYLWESFGLLFKDQEELLENGFAMVAKNTNGEIVSIAGTPHIPYNNEFEVQIVTDPSERKKGLGMIVSIDLLIYSLEREIIPHWDAATSLSGYIGEKLGYSNKEGYPIYARTKLIVIILRATRIPKIIIIIFRKLNIIND